MGPHGGTTQPLLHASSTPPQLEYSARFIEVEEPHVSIESVPVAGTSTLYHASRPNGAQLGLASRPVKKLIAPWRGTPKVSGWAALHRSLATGEPRRSSSA